MSGSTANPRFRQGGEKLRARYEEMHLEAAVSI
jgi:hypothetical protein